MQECVLVHCVYLLCTGVPYIVSERRPLQELAWLPSATCVGSSSTVPSSQVYQSVDTAVYEIDRCCAYTTDESRHSSSRWIDGPLERTLLVGVWKAVSFIDLDPVSYQTSGRWMPCHHTPYEYQGGRTKENWVPCRSAVVPVPPPFLFPPRENHVRENHPLCP